MSSRNASKFSVIKENLSFTFIKLDSVEVKWGLAQYKGSPGRVTAGFTFLPTDGGELFFYDKHSAGLAQSESVTLGVFMWATAQWKAIHLMADPRHSRRQHPGSLAACSSPSVQGSQAGISHSYLCPQRYNTASTGQLPRSQVSPGAVWQWERASELTLGCSLLLCVTITGPWRISGPSLVADLVSAVDACRR